MSATADYQRARYWANREEHLRKAREYRKRRPDVYARTKAYTPERAQRARVDALRRKYGITVGQYEALLAAQGGVCAICLMPETRCVGGSLSPLAVDHIDTESGPVVRGLLCHRCNRAIGLLRDEPDVLRRAADYVAAWSTAL